MTKLYCLECPNGCLLTVLGSDDDGVYATEGGRCEKGAEFAQAEFTDPVRMLTTTVRTKFPEVPVISVRTETEIPREDIADALSEINEMVVETEMAVGDVLIEDVADTEVSVIITSPALMQMGAELENKNAELSSASGGSEDMSAASPGVGEDGEPLSGLEGTVLDEIGEDYVGGIVGAAGEAVGVEDEDEDAGEGEEGPGEGADSPDSEDGKRKEGYRTRSRARISNR